MALTTEGDVYTWGNGNSGQLGHGNKVDTKNPIKIKLQKKVK
jgi:alpha-tubulin suppressor-like RCC1 family protein